MGRVQLTIKNKTSRKLEAKYQNAWFDSGGFTYYNDQPNIEVDEEQTIKLESKGFSSGVSGYIVYEIGGNDIAVAFSNPSFGRNKLDVGTNGYRTWDHMGSHDYDTFVMELKDEKLKFECRCSGGNPNCASVIVTEID